MREYKGISPKKPLWELESKAVQESLKEDIVLHSSVPQLDKLLNNTNVGVVLYAGQFDLMDGPQGIERTLHSLTYKDSENFKVAPRNFWKISDGKNVVTAGYIKQFKTLTFMTMRNAGHFAPRDKIYTSLNLLHHLFSEEPVWECDDKNCDIYEKKCLAMYNCVGNGKCGKATGGKCVCNEGYYGPNCGSVAEKLNNGLLRVSPRDTKIYSLVHWEEDILLEIDTDDSNVQVSLLNKKDHSSIYNYKNHLTTYRLHNKKMVTFIEKTMFKDYLLVISNVELEHEIKVNVFINYYSKFH